MLLKPCSRSTSCVANKDKAIDMSEASLRSIEFDDIQLLRYWRNLDHVRSRMVIANYTGRDDQRNWFEGLNFDSVKYYIFSLGMRDVGCVNLSKINFAEKTFEGGIFCGDTNYLKHWINIWACIKVYNYAFFDLKLDTSFAKVLSNNKAALNLNRSLGYKRIEGGDYDICHFVLTRNDYVKSSEKIQRYLRDFAKQNF
jgi:RimJ/RimL family protein N-acetyltransferase